MEMLENMPLSLKTDLSECLVLHMYLFPMVCGFRELAELQKTNAVSQSAAQEAAASAEKCKQEELKLILEQQNVTAQREKEALLMQVSSLFVWVGL